MRHPEVMPEAVTGNIDAALAARSNASAAELEAGSKQILASWSAKRGHHKRVYGELWLFTRMLAVTSSCRGW